MIVLKYAICIILSYFIGNISFARILSRLKKEDITKKGSGNPGSMNMLRNYGAKFGFLTLFLDALKGAIPSFLGYVVFGGFSGLEIARVGLYVCGLSVIIGHIYPICYKFKGGKGIACTVGVFFVANPFWLLLGFSIAFIYMWYFDYGSIASLIVVTILTIIEALNSTNGDVVCLLLFAIFALTWFAHRKNIIRLLTGTENKANIQKAFMNLNKKSKKMIKNKKNK